MIPSLLTQPSTSSVKTCSSVGKTLKKSNVAERTQVVRRAPKRRAPPLDNISNLLAEEKRANVLRERQAVAMERQAVAMERQAAASEQLVAVNSRIRNLIEE